MVIGMKKTVKCIIAGCVTAVLVGGVILYLVQPDPLETVAVSRQDISQYIKSTGTMSADKTVTVYAPVSGKIATAAGEEGAAVSKDEILAEYDLTSQTNAYNLAAANADYYTDGYEAAVKENRKAQSKYDTAVANADALKEQYIQTQTDINAMDQSQAGKNQYIQSTLQGIENAVANMETELAEHQSRSATATSEKDLLEAQLSALQGQSDEYQRQIKSMEAAIQTRAEEYEAVQAVTTMNPVVQAEKLSELEQANQSASESVAQLKAEKKLIDAQLSPLKSKIATLKDKVSGENASSDSLTDRIAESRDTMATLPVEGMTEAEYGQYAALMQRLDLIEREWSESLTDKETAEAKLMNDSQIAQYEDSAEIARLEKEAAEYNLNQAQNGVKSECNGVIIEKLVDPGAVVEAGQVLYVIQPASGYKVTVMISKYDIDKIAVGQAASVRQGNLTYEGEVSRIYPVAETDASGKPKVKVDVLLQESGESPIIGLEAEVTIYAGTSEQALAVPAAAVYTDDNGDYVYILEKRKAVKRYVTIGVEGTDSVEIMDGLSDSDKVVTTVLSEDAEGR